MDNSMDNLGNSLDSKESEALKNAIGTAILSPANLSEELQDDRMAYLRLIHSASIAQKECSNLLDDAVLQARRLDHSWLAIGEVLGVSRQAAQQRFRVESKPAAIDESKCRRISGATAFNEMEMLRIEGKAGYHLVGFGPLFLMVQESDLHWEHKRILAFGGSQNNGNALESEGWIFVGSWMFFQYFKRAL